jgi:hypothetical protein
MTPLARSSVPGVYGEARPRVAPPAAVRTDVVGFVGFEPRVRDGSTPCQLTGGSAPKGHSFQVDVGGFELPTELFGGARIQVQAAVNLPLSASETEIPMLPGGTASFALVAVPSGKVANLRVVAGPVSATDRVRHPTDEEVIAAVGPSPWARIADIEVRRSAAGDTVFPVVVPALPPVRCDDFRDYVLRVGGPTAAEDGTLLGAAVRAFFANGGARCHVVTIRRPLRGDAPGLAAALTDLVGVAGASEIEATGLEKLLRISEVAVADAPDLHARAIEPAPAAVPLPPRDVEACFRPCDDTLGAPAVRAEGQTRPLAPLFTGDQVLSAQRGMLLRCAAERHRVLLLLCAPLELDLAEGAYRGPTADFAADHRRKLDGLTDDLGASCAAFYHPWVLLQQQIGGPTLEMPPTPLVAGVIARRDLARGPHVAPANEPVAGVVSLSPAVAEDRLGALYDPPLQINPICAFPGRGLLLWGARTLSQDRFLRWVPVRRCLSAIERRVLAALRPLVFEPNTEALWFQVTQAVYGVLLPVFQSGALRGATPEEAFYVRCDDTNNPPDTVLLGQVLCEVGVAIAAPAEFIVFRVGRREAVLEVVE